MRNILFNKNGQSLVEVLIAMIIIMSVVTAVMLLTLNSRNLLYSAEDTSKATALAQEGIEIVKHNRGMGCQFNDLVPDTGSSYHVIESDVYDSGVGDSSNEIKAGAGLPEPSNINGYNGFVRKIYLRDLSGEAWNVDLFGDEGTFDGKDKYYYVRVEITKPGSTMETEAVSTIMLQRWKD
jgi:type II secretory pathway pseudopilin PulG